MLVISKVNSENLLTASDKTAERAFAVAKRFASMCKEKLHASGVSVITNSGRDAGQVVPHFHIHVIPKYPAALREMRYNGRMELTPDAADELSKLLSARQ